MFEWIKNHKVATIAIVATVAGVAYAIKERDALLESVKGVLESTPVATDGQSETSL